MNVIVDIVIYCWFMICIFVSVLKIKRPKSTWCLIGEDTEQMYSKHISVKSDTVNK